MKIQKNSGQFKKGDQSYWKGKKLPDYVREKLSITHKALVAKGQNVPPKRWGAEPWNKGIKTITVSKKYYDNIHYWIRKTFGKAILCEKCGSTKKVEWANISHSYMKKKSDWIQLCKTCHLKYDYGRMSL